MLRVCVIGMGPIGNRHADMYTGDGLSKLAGVCDIRQDRADQAAARLGVPGFYNAQEMLAQVKPDVVSVCTAGKDNGGDHYLPVMQALDAGCHVLCEKPISDEIPKAVANGRAGSEKRINPGHQYEPPLQLCAPAGEILD